MPKFEIFAGVASPFGGEQSYGTRNFNSEEEAKEKAYKLAIKKYESYKGRYGLRSKADLKNELERFHQGEVNEERINSYYREYIDEWLIYYAVQCME